MVSIIDPLGTPTPVYNRSGVTVVTVAAGPPVDPSVGNSTDAPEIPHLSGHTIAIVTTNPGHLVDNRTQQPILLPSNAEVGDVVEVYQDGGPDGRFSLALYAPVGSSLGPGFSVNNGTSAFNITVTNIICRKVNATTWRLIIG